MILNLSVEVSDEVIELCGYSLYARNQKKSAEAEEVFKKLFSNLQSELEKKYQNTAHILQTFDERLKVLEMYSADAQEVDRAINNLNNRVARIDSDLDEHGRQLKNFARQMEQLEKTVDQVYAVVNEEMDQLRKDFATKLKTEVDNQVERLLKRILAENFNDTIKTSVDAVVKDYDFPKPDYSAMIKMEVASAVRNMSAPDYSAMIKAEVANAVRNMSAPDYSAMIKAEVANAVKQELQKTQASNTAVSQYGNLIRRLPVIEKKSPTTVEPQAETPLNIRDEKTWQEYKTRLLDIDKLERFSQNNSDGFYSLASKLSRIRRAVYKIRPEEFNEYTTETIVDKAVDIAKEFMDSLENCNRTINNPKKSSTAAQELSDLIEEYLAGLGIRPMAFKVGDKYEEWADLGMSETPIIDTTNDRKKHNTLKEIYVQPHFIEYLNEHDKKARRVFGGRCVAYGYKD